MEENVLLSHYFPSRGKYLFCAAFICKLTVALSRTGSFGVHLGWTERCSFGRAVGEYTRLSPVRAQPSSPSSFCGRWDSDLILELRAQGSGPWVGKGDCYVPPTLLTLACWRKWNGNEEGEGDCLCRLNLSWPLAPAEEQLCPKGRAGEGAVGFLPPLPTAQPGQPDRLGDVGCAQGARGRWLFPWGQWSASGAPAWEMQGDAGFRRAVYSERCLIATMSHW